MIELLHKNDNETRVAGHKAYAEAWDSQIEAAQEFFTLEYWQRLWVIQEFALGPNLVIIWGSGLETWYDIDYLSKAFLSVGNDLPEPQLGGLTTTLLLRYILATLAPNYPLPLYDALANYANRHCAIPVDKVFGLQAFVSPVDRIKTDYARPAHEVFWTALSKAITSELAAGSKELCRPSEVLSFFRLGVAMGVTAENIDLDNVAVRHCMDIVLHGNDVVWMFSNVRETKSQLNSWYAENEGRAELSPFELDAGPTCDQNQAQAEEDRKPKRVCGTRCEVM